MPGLNGTGPHGRGLMTGRGFGWCRTIDVPSQESAAQVQQANERREAAVPQGFVQDLPVYGRGRGGVPCGCGRGYGFGGGRRLQE